MIISIIKLLILVAILLYASINDIKYREVPDWVSVMLLILGFVNILADMIPTMILGAVLVFLPQYISALISPSKALGGADIKISTAAAFLLGAHKGLFALIIGLALSTIVIPIARKVHHTHKTGAFPLIPFLAVGILTAYLI